MASTHPDLYGLLGYPLGHTLSPRLHAAAFAWANLPGTYLALPVPPERLDGAIAGVRAWRLPGLNVTIPHKTAIIPLLDGLTPIAKAIGAVNTLYWEGERLVGDNTDHAGFAETLPDMRDRTVVVLGAGGAARAVLAALRDRQAGRIHLVARRGAPELLAELAPGGVAATFDDELAPLLAKSRLVVNATSVGMDGASSPLSAAQLAQLPLDALVYDLIYNPPVTPLLALAAERGLATRNGLDMLLGQAAHAFSCWTGVRPPLEVLRSALPPDMMNP